MCNPNDDIYTHNYYWTFLRPLITIIQLLVLGREGISNLLELCKLRLVLLMKIGDIIFRTISLGLVGVTAYLAVGSGVMYMDLRKRNRDFVAQAKEEIARVSTGCDVEI